MRTVYKQHVHFAVINWIGALENAKFKLYKDSNGAKGDAYTNKFYTAESVFVSDANGCLKLQGATEQGIRGLDAGTYWLEEIEAPAGYIKEPLINSAAHLAVPFPTCELANFLTYRQ